MNLTRVITLFVVVAVPAAAGVNGCSANQGGGGSSGGSGGNILLGEGGAESGAGSTAEGGGGGEGGAATTVDDSTCTDPDAATCATCCQDHHAQGIKTYEGALGLCECNNPGVCKSQCSGACGGGSETSECAACISSSLDPDAGGACLQPLATACNGDPDCVALINCANTYCPP